MSHKSSRWLARNYRLIMVAVLLIAAVLRLYGVNNVSPPGLEHDEVAHWLINQDILNGEHGLYFSGAYGHEAGYHYLQSGVMALLGDNVLALRLPSAFLGLLVVAVAFALARRLFGLKTAILSASLLAVLFWPVFYSRLGLRAISLPLLSGLSAIFWWKGWSTSSKELKGEDDQEAVRKSTRSSSPAPERRSLLFFVLGGVLAGLSFYTYMASRVVPIFYVLFVLYLVLLHRPALKKRWPGVLLFFVSYIVVAAPLALYLLGNPGIEYRLVEINQPLNLLQEGNLRPVLDNTLKIIAMFGIRGDPLWRQNVALLPVFGPLVAVFFYLGVAISIYRWRQQRYVFVLLWLLTSTIPSIVTIDAPSSIRIINALPVIAIFPAIGLEVIHFLRRFSTVLTKLSPKNTRYAAFIALVLLFALNIARTSKATFIDWPSSAEVKFVWQEAFTDIAAYLDGDDSSGPVAIGGWTPETMDPPTMVLTLVREDLAIRHFDPLQSLIIPLGNALESNMRIAKPDQLPLDPYLEQRLASWGVNPKSIDSFTLYEMTADVLPQAVSGIGVVFDDEIAFLDAEFLTTCSTSGDVEPSSSTACEVMSTWRVEKAVTDPRRIFLHVVDGDGTIVDQDDGLGVPSRQWVSGDLILQRHSLNLFSDETDLTLRLGVYDPVTSKRLLIGEGEEYYEFGFSE